MESGSDWMSLSDASDLLGVHPTTLRRWADAGEVPYFRTPGGHRRFRRIDLLAWMDGQQTSMALVPRSDALVQSAVSYTRQEMAAHEVTTEPWYIAFGDDARQQMRDTGRRLFGLALQYMSRTRDHEPILQEGRRIGSFYGEESARHGMSLVDTARALFFFRESLMRAARPGQASFGHYDSEDVRIHRQLRHFLDEVMYACLASYEETCRHLPLLGAAS